MMVLSDSCQDMVIENCYISVGDDAIAIKSGWDHYGIAYGRPSTNILIRDLTVRSEVRSVIFLRFVHRRLFLNRFTIMWQDILDTVLDISY